MEDVLPDVHDGDRVRMVVTKSSLSYAEFEQKMGWNPTKRYRMFQKKYWNSLDLMMASLRLNYDFFGIYRVWTQNAMKTTTILVPVTVTLPADFVLDDWGSLVEIFRPASDSSEQ